EADQPDAHTHAALHVLRGGGPTPGLVLRNTYTSATAPVDLLAGGTVNIPINVSEAFLIAQAASAKQLPAIQSVVWQQDGTLLVTFPTAPTSFQSADVVAVIQNTNVPTPTIVPG